MIPEIAKRTIDLAVTAPSADNSQPWRFVNRGDHWEVVYHHAGPKDLFGPTGHATLLSTGALCYNLEQICGTNNTSSSIDTVGNWRLTFVPPDTISEATESALRQRHTNRHPFIGSIINSPIEQIAADNQIKLQFISEPAPIRKIAEAIRICSELRFKNEELHKWLFSSLRWSPSEAEIAGDGLDLRTLHLPPGGKGFMKFISSWPRMSILNLLGISKIMALIDSLPVRNAPALIVISSKKEPGLTWQAGHTLAEIWTKLNRMGLAAHPYYVVTDIAHRLQRSELDEAAAGFAEQALALSRNVLNLEADELPHIVLRIGYPTAYPERSKRKSADSFIIESQLDSLQP